MASWTNVVGCAGKSAAIAGVSMTYYALMRRSVELEKLQQRGESTCDDDITAHLNSHQDIPVNNQRFTSYDYVYEEKQELNEINEATGKNELEDEAGLLEPGKEQHGSSLLSFKSFPTTSESFSCEENTEEEILEEGVGDIDAGLVGETVETTNESQVQSSSIKIPGGDGDINISQSVSCPSQDTIKLDLQPEKSVSRSEKDKTAQCELVCRSRQYVGSKEIKIPAIRLASTIPTKSWIAFPFKIFPARFAAHAAAILFLYSWIICAIFAYKVLHFSYVDVHGSDWEKLILFLWDLRRLVLQPIDEDIDRTPVQKETELAPPTIDNVLHDAGLWHW